MKRTANPSGQSELFTIHASGLCKQVSPRKGETITLLNNVEFTASWRAMTGIVGPSGSGKSTLLYCLAGIEPVSSGQVGVLGQCISAMGPAASARFRRAHLGFVFQSYNLVPSMSVEDNLKLPFILRKTRWPEDQAAKLLDRLGIRGLLKANVTLLSGGEQQRVVWPARCFQIPISSSPMSLLAPLTRRPAMRSSMSLPPLPVDRAMQ